jgi:type IV pilus assembly protein PilM
MDAIRFFIEDIKNFFSAANAVGVDIGTSSIKFVHLTKFKDRVNLKNYGLLETREYLDRGNGLLQSSAIKLDPVLAASLLQVLVREARLKDGRFVASIPSFAAFFAPFDLPLLSPAETAKAVLFQARQFIPLPPEQAVLDWTKTGEFNNAQGGRMQKILLTAIPKETVALYQKAFKLAKLKLVGLETEAQALARAIGPRQTVTLMIDIGAQSTTIAVASEGILRLAGQTDYAGLTLTQALGRSLGLNSQRAEDLKRLRGLSENRGEVELSVALFPFVDIILQEARRLKNLYDRANPEAPVKEVILFGGGAKMSGLSAYVSARLAMPVVSPDIFSPISIPSGLEPALGILNKELAVATGLAFSKVSPFEGSAS